MTETPLDKAHKAMEAAPDDAMARLRFYERLVDSELFLLLVSEARGDDVVPEVFEVENARYILVFDREERLLEFSQKTAFHATLSGREVVLMLAGQGVGIGVNPGVAPSSILLPEAAVRWLSEMLANAPDMVSERPVSVAPPVDMPETLITALDAKLAKAAGLACRAYLVAVTYAGGRRGHMLAIIDAIPEAQNALTKAVSETVGFSGMDAGVLDVGFFAAPDPFCEALEKTGLRFDLPEVAPATAPAPDPGKPPILR